MAEVPCTDLESLVEQLYDALAPLLETPFALFGGEDDPETGSEDLDAWQQHCKGTFCCHMCPGGHFFIRSAQKQLLSRLIRELAGSV